MATRPEIRRYAVRVSYTIPTRSGAVEYTIPLTVDHTYLLGDVKAKLALNLDMSPTLIDVSRIEVLKTWTAYA